MYVKWQMKVIWKKLYEPLAALARSLQEWTSRLVSTNEAHCQEGELTSMLLRKRWIQNGLHCGQQAMKGRKSRNALQQSAASRRAVATRSTNKRVEMTHLDLHTTDTFHTYLHLSNISLIALGGMKRKTNHCLCQTLGFPQILFSRP